MLWSNAKHGKLPIYWGFFPSLSQHFLFSPLPCRGKLSSFQMGLSQSAAAYSSVSGRELFPWKCFSIELRMTARKCPKCTCPPARPLCSSEMWGHRPERDTWMHRWAPPRTQAPTQGASPEIPSPLPSRLFRFALGPQTSHFFLLVFSILSLKITSSKLGAWG